MGGWKDDGWMDGGWVDDGWVVGWMDGKECEVLAKLVFLKLGGGTQWIVLFFFFKLHT